MEIPGLRRVTSASTDREICDAIDLAGAWLSIARPHHRRGSDLPKRFSPDNTWRNRQRRLNPWSWVKPADIGPTGRKNTTLLCRLKELTERGVLEMRYSCGLPRFRVRRPAMLD